MEDDDERRSSQHRPRYSNLHIKDKETITRNLDDTFKLEDGDEEEKEPITPAEALFSAQTYLNRAGTGSKKQAERDRARALEVLNIALGVSAPEKVSTRRQDRERSPDQDPSSPDDDDESKDNRHGRNHDRGDRDDRRRNNRRRDARDDITQNKID